MLFFGVDKRQPEIRLCSEATHVNVADKVDFNGFQWTILVTRLI